MTAEAAVAHALYNAVIHGKHRADVVARRAGMSVSSIYKMAEGRRKILAAHLPAIYRATQDIELFSAMSGADDCGLTVIDKDRVSTSPRMEPEHGALELNALAGEVGRLVLKAAEDGVYDHAEKREIAETARSLRRAAARLELMLVGDEPIKVVG